MEYSFICQTCGGGVIVDGEVNKRQVAYCKTCSVMIDSFKDYIKKQKNIIDYLKKELTEANKRKLIRIDCKVCDDQITNITSDRKGDVEMFYVKCETCVRDLDALYSTINWLRNENQELKDTKEHLVNMIEEIRTELES